MMNISSEQEQKIAVIQSRADPKVRKPCLIDPPSLSHEPVRGIDIISLYKEYGDKSLTVAGPGVLTNPARRLRNAALSLEGLEVPAGIIRYKVYKVRDD